MADKSKIEWTDATANVINGCSLASPGCTNCYAMRMAGSRLKTHPTRAGLTQHSKAGPVWTGEVRFHEPALQQVLAWKAPRMIFWNAHGDMFHENVPDEWIDRCFTAMAMTPQHTHQVLTKRSARMMGYMNKLVLDGRYVRRPGWSSRYPRDDDRLILLQENQTWPLKNVWLGVSVEDQQRANERIPDLLGTPAAVRWISAEPLLGPVDLTRIKAKFWTFSAVDDRVWTNNESGLPHYDPANLYPQIDWVVAGGESGPRARPMHPDWARSLRDQCADAGVAFNFKQWGEWAPQVGAVDGWSIPDNPEISRYDHRDWRGDHWSDPYSRGWQDYVDDDTVSRIGKKQAGRLLDGVEHNAFPEVV